MYLENNYKNFLIKLNLSRIRIACVIAMVLVPLSSAIDIFTLNEETNIFRFFKIRVLCALSALIILGVSYLKPFKNYGVALAIILSWSVSATISSMIWILGFDSPYYAGLNLIILTIVVLFPWRVKETFTASLGIYSFFLFPSLFNAAQIQNFKVYISNNLFLLETIAIALISSYFGNRLRFNEFKARYELSQAHSKLQELDRLKTQFFANISHELRTPLTLILAPVETLMKGGFGPLESRQMKTLEVIRDNALRLLRLIGHLLDLIKIDAQGLKLHMTKVDVKSFLKSILDSIAPLAHQKKLILESDIPSSADFVFDRTEMEKVLINLIYNAVKFTPQGGQIKVKVDKKQDGLEIVVQDTGIGIPPEMQERIFDRFAQVASEATRKFEGTGIGLALCKEIVKLHKGTIRVQSSPGKGSVFTVWIPDEKTFPTVSFDTAPQKGNEWLTEIHKAALISGTDLLLERSPFTSLQSSTSASKPVLLLAEDNPDLLSFLASELQTEYRLFLARHGKEALEILDKNKPDLIVTDIMMPEMDGQELCKKVKTNPALKEIPFIFLTAKASLDMKLEGYELGANDYIVKPFNIEELRAKIKALLSLKKMEDALRAKNAELEKALGDLKKAKDEKLAYIGEMAASLAHEIRNPLQPIRTYIEVLDENKNKPDFISRMVNAILPSLDRMEFLISQLMSLGKTEHLVFTPQDPHRILQETLNILEPKLKIKNINVIKNFSAGSGLLQADRNHLSQVFFNLIRNAFEAMTANGTLEIKTGSILKNGQSLFKIAFKDNGSGMDSETLEHVFEPFFTTKKEKGTGLGLSISKQIIEAHGGKISVQSKTGTGTTFIIELPIKDL